MEAMFKIINEAIDEGLCGRHSSNTFLIGTVEQLSSLSGSNVETT